MGTLEKNSEPSSLLISNKLKEYIAKKKTFFSLEYLPPKTEAGMLNLFLRFERMAEHDPLFIDLTWSAGGGSNRPNLTMQMVNEAQQFCCLTTNMHLTCNTLSKEQVRDILVQAKSFGIRNILALRGDPPQQSDGKELSQDFTHAIDLVKFIRKEFGDYFCISVAGYPFSHPDCTDYLESIRHLKDKVDAGADFVISQLFFRAKEFLNWERDCRAAGITCPILPGVLPIQGYASLRNISKMCSVAVPDSILQDIEPIKDDDAAIKEYGVKYTVDLCTELLQGGAPGLHFYTLNQEIVTSKVLIQLGLSPVKKPRELPWRRPKLDKRNKEEVRPIFWANREKSYISRTSDWFDYPNGRWGDSASPAFGQMSDYHLFLHQHRPNPEEQKKEWGSNPRVPEEIGEVFVAYLEGRISSLPWTDTGIHPETSLIQQDLIDFNKAGFWTINSQPRVSGAVSNDPVVGWGGPGGVVYQRAYLEFFASPKNFKVFLKVMEEYGERLNYQAVNNQGESFTNLKTACAVTWGIFPGREVVQPTIVDPVSFEVWKEEAFQLWISKWAAIYEPESESRKFIQEIHDTYYLINFLDNDFMNGDIFEVTKKMIQCSNK